MHKKGENDAGVPPRCVLLFYGGAGIVGKNYYRGMKRHGDCYGIKEFEEGVFLCGSAYQGMYGSDDDRDAVDRQPSACRRLYRRMQKGNGSSRGSDLL